MYLAFYGTGSIAERHIDAIRRTGQLDVSWVVSRTITHAKQFAEKKSIPHYTTDEDLPLGDPDISGVVIAYPTARHADLARRAFAAGKHVVCEKPFTNDPIDAADLVAKCPPDRQLLITQIRRFWPIFQKTAQFIRSGQAGNLCRIAISFLTEWNWEGRTWRLEDPGGYLLDMHVHDIDLLVWWGAVLPQRIIAIGENRADREGTVLFDYGTWYASLDYCGRVSGRMYPKGALTRYQVVLEHGSVEISVADTIDATFVVDGTVTERYQNAIGDEIRRSWDALWQELAQALSGESPAPVPASEVVYNIRMTMAAVAAMNSRQAQPL